MAAYAFGYVKDSSQSPISGATVGWGSGLTATTDGNGQYMKLIPANTYATVTASKTGYQPDSKSDVTYVDSQPTVIDFTLT